MYGYLNRVLKVDLTTGEWEVLPLVPEYVRRYIGGRGLGARYLWDLLPPGTEPFARENVAVMMTGPFTGTEVYSCQKYEWVTKSPLTGSYLCSNCGGMLGVNLRRAGYDGLILTGAAEEPAYLYIDEDTAELRSAADLWGESVSRAQALLRERVGSEAAVGCIGPAAEPPRAVRFAGFFDGQRSAGRGGLGAVLGSKQLKGIAIVPGHAEVPVFDSQGLSQLLPELTRELKRDRITGDALGSVGTMLWIDTLALNGLLPAENYQRVASYAEIRGRLDSETYRSQFAQLPAGEEDAHSVHCFRCPLQSAKLCTPDRGGSRGKQVRGPEFQSAWALGINCGLLDYQPIIAAFAACNEHGVDAISLGSTIGFAMECCQRGLLDRERIAREYDGLQLNWGNCEAVLSMVDIIAERRGWLGELLADGVRAAAERIPQSVDFALHVKGMEFPSYDPRGVWSMALAYATGCRGACHLKSWTIDAEYSSANGNPTSVEGKAEMVVDAENARAVIDSALVCTFASRAISETWMRSLVQIVMGLELDIDACGREICDLERALALREGIGTRDDKLPFRVCEEPLCGGDYDGVRIGRDNFEQMRDEYYALRGWEDVGTPVLERLSEDL